MTLKDELLRAGIKENEIDHHYSDLYVKKTDISQRFIKGFKFKDQVSIFTDQINHELWYDIPFGYAEHFNTKLRGNE